MLKAFAGAALAASILFNALAHAAWPDRPVTVIVPLAAGGLTDKGVAPPFGDLVAGHVQMASASPVEIKPHLSGGKVRPLGITSQARSQQLPDVPTVSETLPTPAVATCNGFFVPKNTPQEVVDAIAKEVQAAVKTKAFSDKLIQVGLEPVGGTPEEMVATIAADKQNWLAIKGDLVAAASQ
ncbi:MAG: hypothetical protein K2Y27_19035 [Xanthobacteraceae bacterium]|nr:hypothetical protein [Xanthobacteraceae bacterium]